MSVTRRTAAEGCDVMIGNLDPHTPVRVLEALILELGYEDVVVVAGPLIRDNKAYAFINAPPTVNVPTMITDLKSSKLFDCQLEVEIVGSLNSLESQDATVRDGDANSNIAGRPIRAIANATDSASSSVTGPGPVMKHGPQDVKAITKQDSTSKLPEPLTNASQGNLLPKSTESAVEASPRFRLFSNLVWTKPVDGSTTVVTDQSHNTLPHLNESCEAKREA
jgi:hypothetical protein